MDKRVFAAAAASVLILIGWSYLFPPPERPAPPPVEIVEELGRPAPSAAELIEAPSAEAAELESAEPIQADAAVEVLIDNEVFAVRLTNRGGIATSWQLTDESTGFEKLDGRVTSLEHGAIAQEGR